MIAPLAQPPTTAVMTTSPPCPPDTARVLRNSLWLVTGQVCSKVFTFMYVVLLARYLGVEAFGQFNWVVSCVMVADIATDCGLTRLVIRNVARQPEQLNPYLQLIIPLKLLLITAGYGLMLLVVQQVGPGPERFALAAFAGLAMFPLGLGTLLDSACHAYQRMQWSFMAQMALAVFQALVGAAVLVAGGGLWAALTVALLANGCFFMAEAYGVRQLGFKWRWYWQPLAAFALLKQALPYAGVALLGAIAARAELLLLGGLGSATALGHFSLVMKFYEAASVVPIMLASASTPALSQLHVQNPDGLASLYRWTLLRVLALTLAACGAMALLADILVQVLLGPAYADTAPLLRLLFLALPFAGIYIVNGSFLLAADQAKRIFGLTLAVVSLQLTLGYGFIQQGSAQAAVYALLGTQVLAAVLSSAALGYWYRLGPVAIKRAKP